MKYTVRFLPSERRVTAEAGTTLLEAARNAGLPVASACGAEAVCARCGLQVLEGTDSLAAETEREVQIKQRNRIDPRLRLACRVPLQGDLVVTASYW